MLKEMAILALVSLCLPPASQAATIHVPGDQPTIQAGIDAAVDGDTVLVADGTYTGDGNKRINIYNKAITVRSENGPFSCIIDCEKRGRGFDINYNNPEEELVVQGFTIRNGSSSYGAGISISSAAPIIKDNIIIDNSTPGAGSGGGIACSLTGNLPVQPILINNLIARNKAGYGGGIECFDSSPTIINCTFTDNLGYLEGGAIAEYSPVTIENSIIWNNTPVDNLQGIPITYSNVQGGHSGEGNIDEDPLFVNGEMSEYYLSQIASGQPEQSPCVDSGDPADNVIWGSTRTDSLQDEGIVDMGFHYRPTDDLRICSRPANFAIVAPHEGSPPPEQTLLIWRCGNGTLSWTVDDDADWLELWPLAGTSSGEVDEVLIAVDPGDRPQGTYEATITIDAADALNSPILVPVSMIISDGIINVPNEQPTIQAGIDAAFDGETVLVADGWYRGEGNRDLRFNGKAITVRSTNGPEHCVVDCEGIVDGYHFGFAFDDGEGEDSVLKGFHIRRGYYPFSEGQGGGIGCLGTSPTIINNILSQNLAWNEGAGIYCFAASPTIENNIITDNDAFGMGYGGGICCWKSSGIIKNNIITNNKCNEGGAGIACNNSTTIFINNTIADNWDQGLVCDGIMISGPESKPIFRNCIIWEDKPIWVSGTADPIFAYCDVRGGWPGEGNIASDPLFVSGHYGTGWSNYYLSHVAAGQATDSPCKDAGAPASEMINGTTRADRVRDSSITDMGFHFPLAGMIVTGASPVLENPPLVRAYGYEFYAYGAQHFGVNVTCGDVDGNSIDEIITGAGPGSMFGPHVRGFQVDGTPLPGLSFLAYGTDKWGVNVAAGDLDDDGFDEIITGAGPGAVFGPHVRGWNYDGTPGVAPIPGVSYFAYGTPKWGVNVASGDIDGDSLDEIVTGPGPGTVYGPHVRGWNVDGGSAVAIAAVSFMAYGTNRYGVNVTCGDVDGDGIDEIVTGPGPGSMFSPHIRGWDYDGVGVTHLEGFNFIAWRDRRYGAEVYAGADLNDDGRDEVVVGCGPDPSTGTPVRVYCYNDSEVTLLFTYDAYPEGWTHGANVAAGRF